MINSADLLWQHWQAGTVFDSLPVTDCPTTRDDAYAIQAAVELRTAQPLVGWKIAATSEAGQKHINVSGPMAGRLIRERLVEIGTPISLKGNRMRVAEAEFCFRMGTDLPPRETPYTAAECVAASAALHVAIEVPDSRFADFTAVGEAQLIADNACAHDFILGPEAPDSWRHLDLSKHPVLATKNGMDISEGGGWNVLGDPRDGLAWLVNELSGLGITLKAGEVVTTGTSTVPVALAPSDHVVCDFGELGTVAAKFTD